MLLLATWRSILYQVPLHPSTSSASAPSHHACASGRGLLCGPAGSWPSPGRQRQRPWGSSYVPVHTMKAGRECGGMHACHHHCSSEHLQAGLAKGETGEIAAKDPALFHSSTRVYKWLPRTAHVPAHRLPSSCSRLSSSSAPWCRTASCDASSPPWRTPMPLSSSTGATPVKCLGGLSVSPRPGEGRTSPPQTRRAALQDMVVPALVHDSPVYDQARSVSLECTARSFHSICERAHPHSICHACRGSPHPGALCALGHITARANGGVSGCPGEQSVSRLQMKLPGHATISELPTYI